MVAVPEFPFTSIYIITVPTKHGIGWLKKTTQLSNKTTQRLALESSLLSEQIVVFADELSALIALMR